MSVSPVFGIFTLLAIAVLALAIWAIVDIAKSPTLTAGLKTAWVVIVIVAPLVGAAAWLLVRGSLATREG